MSMIPRVIRFSPVMLDAMEHESRRHGISLPELLRRWIAERPEYKKYIGRAAPMVATTVVEAVSAVSEPAKITLNQHELISAAMAAFLIDNPDIADAVSPLDFYISEGVVVYDGGYRREWVYDPDVRP